MEKHLNSDHVALRRSAERLLASSPPAPPIDVDAHRLLHELQVHQIELEMQNAELGRSQAELEQARNLAKSRYDDLYEFAPIGYLTLDKTGLIRAANLTAATLLGVERNALLKQALSALSVFAIWITGNKSSTRQWPRAKIRISTWR
jgi:PAS domain-containing protein